MANGNLSAIFSPTVLAYLGRLVKRSDGFSGRIAEKRSGKWACVALRWLAFESASLCV